MSRNSVLSFKIDLTIDKIYDIPYVSGKFWCKIKPKKSKLDLNLSKLLNLTGNKSHPLHTLSEIDTEYVSLKNHTAIFKFTCSFDQNLEMDNDNFELKSNFVRISVKGQSKRQKNVSNNHVSNNHETVTGGVDLLGQHLDDLKVGFADIDLACFATGQQLQATYPLKSYENKRSTNACIAIQIKMTRLSGTPMFIKKESNQVIISKSGLNKSSHNIHHLKLVQDSTEADSESTLNSRGRKPSQKMFPNSTIIVDEEDVSSQMDWELPSQDQKNEDQIRDRTDPRSCNMPVTEQQRLAQLAVEILLNTV